MVLKEVNDFELTSGLLNTSRRVWVQCSLSPNPLDCLVFLDAELYLQRVQVPDIITRLQCEGRLVSTTCVYVSNGSAADRHVDYICNEVYSRFLATDLRHWIETNVGHHRRMTLCGLSLSGLAAAFAVSRHSSVFSSALCQSPSAWWNDEWLTNSIETTRSNRRRCWVSVGNQELQTGISHPPTGLYQNVSQRESCQRLADKMAHCGYTVRFSEFDGGHDPVCWAAELPSAFDWLLNDN